MLSCPHVQYGLVHISVGDLLREEVKNGTAAGTTQHRQAMTDQQQCLS